MIITIIVFLAILGLLIFVHEFGHFYIARKSGMAVEEFGFGFPPRIVGIQHINGRWSFVWGHHPPADSERTVYSINWIPLGGFVKILGENNERENDSRSFINRPFWGRLATLVAGVAMNVILAWVLLSVGYIAGLPTAVDSQDQIPAHAQLRDQQVAIIETAPGAPAEQAGLAAGDIILEIDGQKASGIDEVRSLIQQRQGQTISFTINHGGQEKTVSVESRQNPAPGEGPTGIALASLGKLSFPWYWAPVEGARTVWYQIQGIAGGLVKLFSSREGLASVGGPVRIAQLTGEVRGLGFIYVIQFAAFLSLNLALLNILPFPALDGGRVLFLLIEKIRGKRNNQRVEQWVNTAGFLLLLLLMVVVTVKDIIKH